eukprot:TRINITY_DN9712_c0_g1_i1.p2 TRINITY_DN9712_c0_g1~~TRINITY_DN9712_c0_g1_i1.p2  ORF type:complete len:143 (+),score=36.08 TRINITY_DN9712_c0_g1_i1:45-431(+)
MAKGKRSKVKQHHKREFNARIKPVVDARIADLNKSITNPDEKMEEAPAAPGEWVVKKHPIPVRKQPKAPVAEMEVDEGQGEAQPIPLAGSTTTKHAKATTSKVVGKIQKSTSKSAGGKKIKIRLTKTA